MADEIQSCGEALGPESQHRLLADDQQRSCEDASRSEGVRGLGVAT